jgi:hypothetical protein
MDSMLLEPRQLELFDYVDDALCAMSLTGASLVRLAYYDARAYEWAKYWRDTVINQKARVIDPQDFAPIRKRGEEPESFTRRLLYLSLVNAV